MYCCSGNTDEAVRLIDAYVACAHLCVAIIALEDRMCLPEYHVAMLRHLISSLAFLTAHAKVAQLKTRWRLVKINSTYET